MRIASWNVNSIRARIDHVADWLRAAQPDVLCLQETKVVDSEFPADTFARLGYESVYIGQSSYNGVAIVSRHPVDKVTAGLLAPLPGDGARLIAGTVRGVRIFSAYVPNGKSLDSPSYGEKLEWLKRLRQTLDAVASSWTPLVLCGDFNIAREDRDVFDPEWMRGKIHFSEPEHRALDGLLDFGLIDTFRHLHEEPERFTWWDYRMGAFRRNRGLRIDYIFATRPLIETLCAAEIDQKPRDWPKPSDHAPLVIELSEPMVRQMV